MAMRIFNADETIFTSNGLKSIQPIYCHEIRNESEWYLDVRVPLSFLEYTIQDNIIVVETLDKGEQAFRIRNITVGQDIKFEAWHIGYDSRVFTVALSTFVNLNPTQALTQLLADTQTNNFTVFSNIATQLSFSIIDVPLYDALIDMAERYNAVLEFDNWQIRLVSSIGSDKGVTVAYGKNLESSSFEENWDMVVTELYPKGNNGLVGTTLYSSIVYDRPYAKIVSFDTDDLTTLNNLASAYLSRFEKPRVNYKVKSDVILASLGDTIKVVAKQFELFTDVLSYKFNVITRKMIELEFGNYRPTIRNAIGQLRAEVVEQSRNITQLKIDEVNGEISAIVSDVDDLEGQVSSNTAQLVIQANQIQLGVKSSSNTRDSVVPYNQFDWEQGRISISTGLNVADSTLLRTIGFHQVKPSAQYILECSDTLGLTDTVVIWYNGTTFLSAVNFSPNGKIVTSPATATNCRVIIRKSGGGVFVTSELPNHFVRVSPNATLQELTNYSTITQTANDITLAVSTASNGTDSVVPYDISRWEQGTIDAGSGNNVVSNTRLRTITFYEVLPSTDYVFQKSNTIDVAYIFYQSNGTFISLTAWVTANDTKITTPSNAGRIRLVIKKPNDSVFNLSEMPNHFVRVTRTATLQELSSQLTIRDNQIATKVEQSTFNTLSGRVTNAETSITQQANAIALKADQTIVDGRIGKNFVPTLFKDWEAGDYSVSTGDKANTADRIRVPFLIKINPNTQYYFTTNNSVIQFVMRTYGIDKNFLSSVGPITNEQVITFNSATHYIGISLFNASQSQYQTSFSDGTLRPFICLNQESDKTFEHYQYRGDGTEQRISSAELRITPTAITSTVRSSTEYTNDLGGKENTVFKQNTAPAHLNGRLWLNTSVTPNVLNRSNGTAWVRATPTQASEVGAYSSGQVDTILTSYSTITQTANDITLAVSTSSNGTDSIVPYDISRWEQGSISNGVPAVNATRLRTKDFYTVSPSTDYIIQKSSSINVVYMFFQSNGTLISSSGWETSNDFKITSPSNAGRVKLVIMKPDESVFNLNEMPNHWIRVVPVGKYLKGSKFEINGEKIISQADGIEFQNASGTPVVFFDTVNNRFTFNGHILANTGSIGRFAISGQDLVYTSELFDYPYDKTDVTRLQRILAGIISATSYDLWVYDTNSSGTLTTTDLTQINNFVESGTALPTPRKRIRSVVTIGTNNGALITQAVAENGAVGGITTMRGNKITTSLINANSLNVASIEVAQISIGGTVYNVTRDSNGFLKAT